MTDESTKAFSKGSNSTHENLKIQQLFKLMVDSKASDLHISPGSSPAMRVNGDIIRVKIGFLLIYLFLRR